MHPTLNAHDNLCFPLRRAYLLLYVFTLCWSKGDSHISLFIFILWQAPRVWKIMIYIYIQLDVSWHRLLLLTSPKGEYVGRQHNKPLYFLVSGWNSITTSIAWVLAIIEDYMIVEYVDLLKSSIGDSFWCYDKLQLLQWLRLYFVSSQWGFWTILDIVNCLLLEHRKSYDKIYICCCY